MRFCKKKIRPPVLIVIITCLCPFFFSVSINAQKDTSHSTSLDTLLIIGKKSTLLPATALPTQTLSLPALQQLSSLSVADAVKYFSGVQVKDYGGIGGLKTFSVRSLGAAHAGVLYNGVLLDDAQNGQIDLGKISLDNIGEISLYNAQPATLPQTAKAFAYSSVLSINTLNPFLQPQKKNYTTISFKTGSFGLINPSATFYHQWNSRFFSGLNAEWQHANGAYNFTYKNGYKTEKGRRSNADINAVRFESNNQYSINDSNKINATLYYYHSDRGLPGSIILYRGQGTQHAWDENFFAQANWQNRISPKSRLLVSGKYNMAFSRYLDTSFINNNSSLDMTFRQREYYISAAYRYDLWQHLQLSYSADFSYTSLQGDSLFKKQSGEPARTILLNNLSALYSGKQFSLGANILRTDVFNINPSSANNFHELSPAVEFILQPLNILPLRVRAFYKNIFRLPTFNDLYYTYIGNTSLKPEYARQWNIGITWHKSYPHSFISSFYFTADAYRNHLKDMILAIPRQNIWQWSMQNIGKVAVNGIDIVSKTSFKPWGDWYLSVQGGLTLQKSIDNDPASPAYKNDIPYTPRQFGSANLFLSYKKLSFAYNGLFSGSRFNLPYNTNGIRLPAWATQDMNLNYLIKCKSAITWLLSASLNNIFNQQYQIINFYPMPGRNFRLGIKCSI